MIESNSLKEQTAIVTGATRGIGRAIALKLASDGANVAFNYMNNDELAYSLKNEIEAMGVRSLAFKVDIRNYDQVQSMKNSVLENFGTFNILVNNAGIIKDGVFAMLSNEDWQDVIDTNLLGTYNASKAAVFTFMKQKRGNIINIASVSGLIGMVGQTNYSASKGGIIAFTKSLAKEVAQFNVRVNVIAPGFIETDMTKGLKPDMQKQMLDAIPLGRFGRVEEVAGVASFLLSELSGYITGQVIQIDGGMAM